MPEQLEVSSRATFKVFNPQTGTYETREVEMPVPAMPASVPQVTQTAAPMQAPAVQERPPVLVYNAKTGQYEPQDLKEYRAPAPARKQAEPKKKRP